mmetsp:Transcript_28050/g.24767  ORF Transcript_28050/g.24767 Transcript_28050/m.24767 type:complete len:216 (+) Transcript_28050:883-1530(+)
MKQKELNPVCEICTDPLYQREFKPIESCNHVFHEDCIVEFLRVKIDEKSIPIRCPASGCKSFVTLTDLVEWVNTDYQEKYVTYSIRLYLDNNGDDVSCCPTPDCPYVFLRDEGQNKLSCPVCKKSYCFNCKCEMHEGITCLQYRQANNITNETEIKELQPTKYKQCPRCRHWISKTEGCDGLTCRCGMQICYHCGREGDGHFCPCRTKGIVKPIV